MIRLAAVPLATAAVSVPIGFRVLAAESENKTETNGSTKCKPSELPIYGDPEPVEYKFHPEDKSGFMNGISTFRTSIWTVMDNFQGTTDKVKDKFGIAQNHSTDLLHYIQEDASIVPRAVIITVAGLGGIVAGYKGRYFKKGIYAAIGMISAASICYPNQAVDIVQYGWSKVKSDAKDSLRSALGGKKREEDAEKSEEITVVKVQEGQKEISPKEDHGQSKPEDKDMYTTRGS